MTFWHDARYASLPLLVLVRVWHGLAREHFFHARNKTARGWNMFSTCHTSAPYSSLIVPSVGYTAIG